MNSNVSSSFLFSLSLSLSNTQKSGVREKILTRFSYLTFSLSKECEEEEGIKRAGRTRYDTRVRIRAKMSIAFYIELSTLSLSPSLSLSLHFCLFPLLSLSLIFVLVRFLFSLTSL